jgi:hypothetical protein
MIAMLTLFRDSAVPTQILVAKPDPGTPDYDGLASFLNDFLSPPDAFGEISINADEAQQLRRLGWSARAGAWRAPLIPWEFIAPYRSLWILDDAIDPASRSVPWRPKRAVFHRLEPVDPLSTLDHRLLGLLRSAPHGRLTRRHLQQRVSRDIPTRLLDYRLSQLQEEGFIAITADGWVCPLNKV